MSKRVILVHEYSQNNDTYYGFDVINKVAKNYQEIVNQSLLSIGEYNQERKLIIHTWGEKKHDEPDCQTTFDVTKFSTKTDKDIRNIDGRHESIQNAIIQHPIYDILIETIIREIEDNNLEKISFVCNHGKHRSVGWAEILKKFYYKNSEVKHVRFK
jgi:RNase adaptor protein for sRNA GlmZ degradation